MDKPTRLSDEKYNRILELSEKIKVTRPSEGKIIHKLILHIEEMYEYLDFIEKGEDTGLDDEALARLGVPINQIETSNTPIRRSSSNASPARSGRGSRAGRPIGGSRQTGWQAQPTNLDFLDEY